MEILRRYRCDYGHEWRVACQEGADELPEHVTCPLGHEAVTRSVEEPADEVQILVKPAARIIDPVRRQLVDEGRYWLILLDRRGSELRRSAKIYTWDEAVLLGQQFRGKSAEGAKEWWQKKLP